MDLGSASFIDGILATIGPVTAAYVDLRASASICNSDTPGLLNFGHVAFMLVGRLRHGDHGRTSADRSGLGSSSGSLTAVFLGLPPRSPHAAPARRLPRDHNDRSRRGDPARRAVESWARAADQRSLRNPRVSPTPSLPSIRSLRQSLYGIGSLGHHRSSETLGNDRRLGADRGPPDLADPPPHQQPLGPRAQSDPGRRGCHDARSARTSSPTSFRRLMIGGAIGGIAGHAAGHRAAECHTRRVSAPGSRSSSTSSSFSEEQAPSSGRSFVRCAFSSSSSSPFDALMVNAQAEHRSWVGRSDLTPAAAGQVKLVFVGVGMMVLMIYRPQGILGKSGGGPDR